MRTRKGRGDKPSQYDATDGDVIAWAYYDGFLRQADAMDFDDVLLHCRNLLREKGDIRRQLTRDYAYMLVDEYQDSNQIQVLSVS